LTSAIEVENCELLYSTGILNVEDDLIRISLRYLVIENQNDGATRWCKTVRL